MPIRLAGYVFTKELPFLQSKKSERGKKNAQQELFSKAKNSHLLLIQKLSTSKINFFNRIN